MVAAAAPAAAGASVETISARRRRSRLSGGHLAMLVAGLVGVVLTLALLRGADHRVPVAVAAHDLAPGTRLRAADVRYSPVAMSDDLLATTLDRAGVRRASGQVVVGPIRAGELVTRGRLRPHAATGGRRAARCSSTPTTSRRPSPRGSRSRSSPTCGAPSTRSSTEWVDSRKR